MRYDTNIIGFIFKSNTSGVIYPNKCDPLWAVTVEGYKRTPAILPWLHTALEFSFCSGIQSQILKHAKEEGYYFMAAPWFRSA